MTNQPPHTPPNVHNANSLIWFNDDVDNGVKLHNNVPIIYIIFYIHQTFWWLVPYRSDHCHPGRDCSHKIGHISSQDVKYNSESVTAHCNLCSLRKQTECSIASFLHQRHVILLEWLEQQQGSISVYFQLFCSRHHTRINFPNTD